MKAAAAVNVELHRQDERRGGVVGGWRAANPAEESAAPPSASSFSYSPESWKLCSRPKTNPGSTVLKGE